MSHSPLKESVVVDEYSKAWEALFELLYSGGSLSGRERNCCFLNSGEHPFTDVSAVAGFDFEDDGRAIGTVDWDHDGRLDVWLVNRTAPRARFLRNVSDNNNQFVAFKLEGTDSNRDAIGSRVTIELSDGRTIVETLRAGMGYLSQSSKWVHFGLGASVEIESVSVRWPGGKTEQFNEIVAGQRYELVQGNGVAVEFEKRAQQVKLIATTCTAPPSPEQARIVLAGRIPVAELWYQNLDGDNHQWIANQKPTLINLWASWCTPCVSELKEFVNDKSLTSELEFLLLNVDEPGDRQAALDTLSSIGWNGRNGFAKPETLDYLDAIQQSVLSHKRTMPVPTSFLIDSNGKIAVIYKGAISIEQLKKDVELCKASNEEVWNAAVPFAGRWFEQPHAAAHTQMAIATRFINDGNSKMASRYLAGLTSQIDPKKFAEGAEGRMTLAGAQLNLAAKLYEQGNAVAAMRLISEALEYAPNFAKAHYNLGVIQQNEGDVREAMKSFESAIASEPLHAFANFNLGALLVSSKPLVAKKYFLRAIESNPRFTDARYNLGLLELSARNFASAKAQFQKILEYEQHAASHYQLGNCSLAQNQTDAAIASYQVAIEVKPEFADARTNLAAILLSIGRLDESLPHFKMVADLQPLVSRSQFNYGVALMQSGRFDEAIELVRATLRLDSEYPMARLRLSQILLQTTSPTSDVLEESIKLARQSADAEPATRQSAETLIRKAERLLKSAGN